MRTPSPPLIAALLLALCAAAEAADALPETMDPDGDGVVTHAEFLEFRRARAFAQDADADGVLSEEEFVATLPARLPSMFHGRAFRQVDADGDGVITAQELDAAPARAFDRADSDGDGRLAGAETDVLREGLAQD